MYDINTKYVKKGKRVFYLFIFVGLLFIGVLVAVILDSYNKSNDMDSETMSKRVEINQYLDSDGQTMYSPVYFYEVNGTDYQCSSGSSSSIRPSTDNGKVFYKSSDPSKCMTEYTKKANIWLYVALLIPILALVIGISNVIKINKRIKLIGELNQKGKLVKNLKYHLENTGVVVNNVPIQKPVVDYILPSGSVIRLEGDPRNDRKHVDSDGFVDLVIDESDPNNYFIDFEINRLTGNLPSDFYHYPEENETNNSQNVVQNNTVQSTVPQPTLEQSQQIQQNTYDQFMNQNSNQNM